MYKFSVIRNEAGNISYQAENKFSTINITDWVIKSGLELEEAKTIVIQYRNEFNYAHSIK